jgi:hypothetical protein
MTPTLLGRWQIRVFLLGTVGLLISILVALSIGGNFQIPLMTLLYVLLFGLVWDALYQVITSYRWDRDWPTSYQVAAGIIEGALVWALILTGKLPGIPEPPRFIVFLIQYGAIWLSIFLLTQGPLRIFWMNWRYQGGQWFVSRRAHTVDHTYQQPVTASQFIGGYNPVAPPQVLRAGNFERRQSPASPAGLRPLQSDTCACGFAFDRSTGNFCPRCGRIKAQQGVS